MLPAGRPIDTPAVAEPIVVRCGVGEAELAGDGLASRLGPGATGGRFAFSGRVIAQGRRAHVGIGPEPVDDVVLDQGVGARAFAEGGERVEAVAPAGVAPS